VANEFQERRRFPRVVVDESHYEVRIARRVRVRLLDISASGALLASEERLPAGITGRLRLFLSGAPFESAVEVTRDEQSVQGRGRTAGVVMVSMQPGQRDTLEDFLRRAGT
jgi:c-di-GMP-binding flagellar brake protein YcgR